MYPFLPYEKGVNSGNLFVLLDVPEVGRFGVSICYEGWVPETTRALVWKGAEVIIHPTMTGTIDRAQELIIAQANAIVNQCYFVDVNNAGQLGNGRSIFVGPEGDIIHQSGEVGEQVPFTIDLNRVREVRRPGTLRLGQILKSFRDTPIDFPCYRGEYRASPSRDALAASHAREIEIWSTIPPVSPISRLICAGGSLSDQLFQAMRQSIVDGASDTATELAQEALANGVDPLEAVNQGFAAGITFAGDQFGCGQMFLPDLLASAEAMKAAINILEPEMLKRGSQRETLGKIILGTARGDIHDIGKNLVATILSASGFQVFDLGTSVTPEQFVAKAKEVDADIVGISALLTTTMAGQKAVIDALDQNGLRPRVKAIIGGAAVTQKWAAEIGADGYSRNAIDALELAKNLMSKVMNKVIKKETAQA